MCSVAARDQSSTVDDRTAKARIRDAAIACFAELGVRETTARKVAAAAGVSPGLVIHHFESMEGLRTACDEHVAATIRRTKQEAIGAGPGLDVAAAWRDTDLGHLGGYLAKVLVDDSPAVAKLVDELVADAVGYLRDGIDTGLIRPLADIRGVARVLMLWSLGGLVLHDHMKRLLGVDLTEPAIDPDTVLAAYGRPAYEILSEGIFTRAAATHLKDAAAAAGGASKGTP